MTQVVYRLTRDNCQEGGGMACQARVSRTWRTQTRTWLTWTTLRMTMTTMLLWQLKTQCHYEMKPNLVEQGSWMKEASSSARKSNAVRLEWVAKQGRQLGKHLQSRQFKKNKIHRATLISVQIHWEVWLALKSSRLQASIKSLRMRTALSWRLSLVDTMNKQLLIIAQRRNSVI